MLYSMNDCVIEKVVDPFQFGAKKKKGDVTPVPGWYKRAAGT